MHTCRERPDDLSNDQQIAQTGWADILDFNPPLSWKQARAVKLIKTNWLRSECQYDRRAADPDCDGCARQKK